MADPKYIPVNGESGAGRTAQICDSVIHWIAYGLAALVPLFFLPWTTDVLELNKQLLVISGAVVAGMCWLAKSMALGRFEYRRSIANVFVALFLVAYAVSAWLSDSRYMSMMGDFGQEKAGFITTLAFVALYFTLTANLSGVAALRKMLYATVVGGFVAGVYALMQGTGTFLLPFSFAQTPSFNTVGTAASLGVYLSFVTALCGALMLVDRSDGKRPQPAGPLATAFLALTGAISLFLICVIDYWPVTLALLVSSVLLGAFAFLHAKAVRGIGGIILPVAGIALSLVLLVIRFPVSLGFPAEVMPSFKASALIAAETLKDKPFFGSGPGTFVFDYAKYRAPEVNASQFWNIRFDRGASRALTSLATTGIVGTLAWALVAFYLAWSAGRRLLRADDETWHLLIAVFAGWTALLVARFTYSSSMTLEYAFWMMLAALVMAHRQEYASFRLEKSPRAALAVSFLFIGGLIVSLAGAYVVGTRYYAETAYAKAVKLSMTDGASEDVVKALESAVDFNGHNDVYLRNLSQAYLGQAQVAIGSVSGEDQQAKLEEMSKFAEGAIGAAKSATVAAPNNVANWSMLGSVYQALIGVSEGADEWAIKSFEKAIELEPSNPEHHAQIGLVHMVLADLTLQAAAQSQDEEAKTKAKGVSDESLGKATEFFERAITLKADYAPAHYQLSLALDRMGKLKEAIIKMEQAIVLGPQDMGARFQLALLYYRDERKTDALALLESVVQTEPKFSNARWYLAALYEEMGRIDDAIAQIDEVAKLNPDSDAVSQKQADLAAKKTGGEGLPEPVEEGVENSNEPGI